MNSAYQEIDKQLLGYQGRLYPNDMKIEVRSAGVPEIREWSNINENDIRSVAQHIIDIITKCVRVTSTIGGKTYNVKDIYEHDKMCLLLLIHQLTFADKKDNMLYVHGECSNTACGRQFDKLAVTPANLLYNVPDEKFEKYIDSERGLFVIQTKNFGTIEYKPATIGLGQAMMNWVSTFKPKFVQENQAMFRMVQSLVQDWRLANDKSLRKLQVEEYNTMNTDVLSFRTELLDQLNIELKDELEYECPDCHSSFRCQLAFEGRYRTLFMPVSNIDSELL
jgi:hypothetical protein